MQWYQNPSDATFATYADFFYSPSDILETGHRLTIGIQTAGDETTIARFIGCIVIGMMPSQGIPEVVRSLKDMWEFYTEELPAMKTPRLPAERREADVVYHETRPEMVISP